MFWEGDQSIGIRGCTGRPISTARVRFIVTQPAPRCWCRASRSTAVPKPGLGISFLGQKCFTSGLGWIKHPQACSTTSILNSPAAGLMFGTRTRWQSPGQTKGVGSEPRPPLGLPGHAKRLIQTSGPGSSEIAPMSARTAG